MKRLLAFWIAVVLAVLPACAEETATGWQIKASEFVVTFGDQTFSLSPAAVVELQADADEFRFGSRVEYADRELLYNQFQFQDNLLRLRLGDSSVYQLDISEWGLLPVIVLPDAQELSTLLGGICFDFADCFQENAPEDGEPLVLDAAALAQWLDAEMDACSDRTRAAVSQYLYVRFIGPMSKKVDDDIYLSPWEPFADKLPTIHTAADALEGSRIGLKASKAEGAGWTLTLMDGAASLYSVNLAYGCDAIGAERRFFPESFAEPAEDVMTLTFGQDNAGFVLIHRRGDVAISWEQASDASGMAHTTQSMQWIWDPAEDGSTDFSLDYQTSVKVEDETFYNTSSQTQLTVSGNAGADGNVQADVAVLNASSNMPDAQVTFRINGGPAAIEDRMAGVKVVEVDQELDRRLTLALAGMAGDVEALLNDTVIASLSDAFDAAWEKKVEIYERAREEDERTVEDLPYPVPEFTWIPERFEWVSTHVYEYGDVCWIDYSAEGGAQLRIQLSPEVDAATEYTLDADGKLVEVSEPPLKIEMGKDSTEATLREGGVKIRIWTYNDTLTPEEIQSILDGRVYPEDAAQAS